MSSSSNRRDFLVRGAAAGAGLIATQQAIRPEMASAAHAEPAIPGRRRDDDFPRMHAGLGGPVGSPTDRGKLVPGLRDVGLPPVRVITPDMDKLPSQVINGVREFHLRPMPVKRELLPGITMDAYGYNGQFPGPTIEVEQGERVRIVVQNDLPEATTVHWHGLELPVAMDGIPFVTQELIPPGGEFVYEFHVHQEGTYFYHPHVAMQEAIGMVGPFIIYPKTAYQPVVDRDFVLVTQQFSIKPNSTIPDTTSMDWNFLTLNGRCGPYSTPMVCKLGERVRIRYVNFSTLHQHPMHIHGHTFWVTGTEGGRIPESAWIPGNTVIVGVAQVREIEFIANNPGDWVMHCHMFHHMMNHMTRQAGPLLRHAPDDPRYEIPGFPQIMEGMKMDPEEARKVTAPRETAGMRPHWFMGVKGLFSVVRVLPPDLFDKVMNTDEPIPPGISVPGAEHMHG